LPKKKKKKIKNHKPHHTQTDTCFPPTPHKHLQYHIRSTRTQQQNKVSKLTITISKNQVNKHSNFKIYFKSNTYPVTQQERERKNERDLVAVEWTVNDEEQAAVVEES
jgi:hypothetical protein